MAIYEEKKQKSDGREGEVQSGRIIRTKLPRCSKKQGVNTATHTTSESYMGTYLLG